MQSEYESVRDYIEAREAGDTETTARIVAEVSARLEIRPADRAEAVELLEATLATDLGGSMSDRQLDAVAVEDELNARDNAQEG